MNGLLLFVQFLCLYSCVSFTIKNMAGGHYALTAFCAGASMAATYLFFYTLGSIGAFGD